MHRMKSIFTGMLMLATIPLFYLFVLVARKKNLWVFSSWQGNKYRGKVRYFFEYISKQHGGKIDPVWVTNNDRILDRIRNDGHKAYKMYSIRGLLSQLQASHYFVSHGSVDFVPFLSRTASASPVRSPPRTAFSALTFSAN